MSVRSDNYWEKSRTFYVVTSRYAIEKNMQAPLEVIVQKINYKTDLVSYYKALFFKNSILALVKNAFISSLVGFFSPTYITSSS